jgi:hypothetical protein
MMTEENGHELKDETILEIMNKYFAEIELCNTQA